MKDGKTVKMCISKAGRFFLTEFIIAHKAEDENANFKFGPIAYCFGSYSLVQPNLLFCTLGYPRRAVLGGWVSGCGTISVMIITHERTIVTFGFRGNAVPRNSAFCGRRIVSMSRIQVNPEFNAVPSEYSICILMYRVRHKLG